jgi:hypothetical protein
LLRWFVLLALAWLAIRLVGRFLNPRRKPGIGRSGSADAAEDRLGDLTRQEIADADFEEIPKDE